MVVLASIGQCLPSIRIRTPCEIVVVDGRLGMGLDPLMAQEPLAPARSVAAFSHADHTCNWRRGSPAAQPRVVRFVQVMVMHISLIGAKSDG